MATEDQFNANDKEMAKNIGIIMVDPTLCAGCMACESVCSVANRGKSSTSLTLIQIDGNPLRSQYSLKKSKRCINAPCLKVISSTVPQCVEHCPMGALTYISPKCR